MLLTEEQQAELTRVLEAVSRSSLNPTAIPTWSPSVLRSVNRCAVVGGFAVVGTTYTLAGFFAPILLT